MSSRCLCENYFGIIMPPTHRFKSLFGCGATPDGAWTVRGKIRNDMMTVIALKEPAWLCVVCVAVYCHMGGSVSLPVGYCGLCGFWIFSC